MKKKFIKGALHSRNGVSQLQSKDYQNLRCDVGNSIEVLSSVA